MTTNPTRLWISLYEFFKLLRSPASAIEPEWFDLNVYVVTNRLRY
jgi:hypothetical protein